MKTTGGSVTRKKNKREGNRALILSATCVKNKGGINANGTYIFWIHGNECWRRSHQRGVGGVVSVRAGSEIVK